MAKMKNPPEFIDRLTAALTGQLMANGIKADIRFERVPTTRLYRVFVFAPKFKHMQHSERQNVVWRIASNALTPDELARISMIVTLTPMEKKKMG